MANLTKECSMLKNFALATVSLLALTVSASAADMRMPMKAAPAPMVAVFNWTGFYVGVNGGYGWGGSRDVIVTETFNGVLTPVGPFPGVGNFGALEPSGAFLGGQIGYNWQPVGSNWLFGVEADLQWSDIKDSSIATLPYGIAPNTITVAGAAKVDWFGTVRGRIGYSFDRVLVYATGGLAYGSTSYALAMTQTLGFSAAAGGSSTNTGYAVGGGLEWAFAPNWSTKLEYQYIDLGDRNVNAPEFRLGAATPWAIAGESRTSFHTARVGVNYRFGPY